MYVESLLRRLVLCLVGVAASAGGQEPGLAPVDRIRLAEAFRLAGQLGDGVWPGWSRAPFPVLLITPERELLLREQSCPEGFTSLGKDAVLARWVCARPRTASPDLRATYPAVEGIPTAVVGTAEGTGLASTEWVLMLLHEHFHQLQMSRPGYWDAVAALDLAGGDTSGMWMLNYPFPYGEEPVARALAAAASSLASDPPAAGAHAALKTVLSTLEPANARYFAFQIWQEGIARYTEITLAERAAKAFRPSREFLALPDVRSFAEVARELRADTLAASRELDLAKHGREALYPLGAALALHLDRTDPAWKERYWSQPLHLP